MEGRPGTSYKHWVTLFDDLEDDEFDGALGEEDPDLPRIQLAYSLFYEGVKPAEQEKAPEPVKEEAKAPPVRKGSGPTPKSGITRKSAIPRKSATSAAQIQSRRLAAPAPAPAPVEEEKDKGFDLDQASQKYKVDVLKKELGLKLQGLISSLKDEQNKLEGEDADRVEVLNTLEDF